MPMDPDTQAAFDEVDRREEEAREFSRETRKLLEALGRQPAPAKKAQRVLADEFAEVIRPQPRPQGATTMSPEQIRRWNEDQHILTAINEKWERELTPMILRWIDQAFDNLSEQAAKEFDKERAYTNKEIEALKAEVAALRADQTIDRAIHKESLTLPNFLPARGRDA
jgi:hypothetical protein